MKKLLFLLLLFPFALVAQTPYNNLPNVYSDIVKAPNGTPMNVMVYLPGDYKSKVYPAFWFWNGRTEDTGPVSQLAVWGPFSFIGAKWQPNFIVVAVQALEWGNLAQTDAVFTSLKAAYNFGDVVASGLSDGGYGCTKLISYYPASIAAKSVRAIIPMSTAEGFGSTAISPTIASKIGVWGFGDDPGDVHGVNTHNFLASLIAANPSGPYRWTNTNPDGHGGWNKHYDPAYKENGLNIYDWAMRFVTPARPVALPPAPVAKIIIDSTTIHYPRSYVRVNGDSSLRAVVFQWRTLSGPSAPIFTPVPGAKTDMLISGLLPGSYVFQLFVNDSVAQTDSASIVVNVLPAACPVCPPLRTAVGIQIVINGQLTTIPLSGTKITYSDGNL